MNILIICHYYPPINSIASLRPYAYARYWTEAGHRVTVLTTIKSAGANELPPTGAEVIELSYRGSALIAATKDQHNMQHNAYSDSRLRCLIAKCVKNLRSKYGILAAERMPEMISGWYWAAKRFVDQRINEYDVVVAEYSPSTALAVGVYAKKASGGRIKLVFDYRDSWTVSNYSQPGLPVFRPIERLMENWFIRSADLITATQRGIVKEFESRGVSHVAVIENGYFDDIPDNCDDPIPEGINLVYTGSYGGYRSIDFLQGALEILEKEDPEIYARLNIFILGHGETRCDHPKIKLLGKVEYSQALHYQKHATILMIVESGEPVAEYNIPGKFFEYFRYAKPIIAFGPKPSFEIARYLALHRIGTVCAPLPEEAASVIRSIVNNPCKYSGYQLELFSRRAKALQLLELIKTVKQS